LGRKLLLTLALGGGARAVLTNGATPQGRFTVTVSSEPAQSYVSNSGQIVTTP